MLNTMPLWFWKAIALSFTGARLWNLANRSCWTGMSLLLLLRKYSLIRQTCKSLERYHFACSQWRCYWPNPPGCWLCWLCFGLGGISMEQDELTHRIIEDGSVWSSQESHQTCHAMAAQGQGGAGQPPLLFLGSFVGTHWHRGRSWLEDSSGWVGSGLCSGRAAWVSGQGERGVERMAAPSQGKDPSDHFYSLVIAANWFFCIHGLVLVILTWGWVRCVVR